MNEFDHSFRKVIKKDPPKVVQGGVIIYDWVVINYDYPVIIYDSFGVHF